MLERADRFFAARERFGAGAEGAHEEQRHRLRLAGRELGKRPHGRAQTLLQIAAGAEGLQHGLRGARGDLVVGAQQQLFLVGIELIEGGARDVGELGQVEDAHGLVAARGDQLGHRALQTLALVALYLLAREPVRAGGQAPVALAGALAGATTVLDARVGGCPPPVCGFGGRSVHGPACRL